MTSSRQISVIVPVWNAADTLATSLEAIRRQLDPLRHELLVVDNNSTDGSADLATRVAGQEPLREPRQGSYAARNRGIAESRGRVLAFVDPDCVPSAGWLEVIEQAFGDPALQVLLGKRLFPSPGPALRLLSLYDTVVAESIFSGSKGDLYFGYTNNMAVRRDSFDRLGSFPELPRGADTVFVRRVVEASGCDAVRFDESMTVTHLEIRSVTDFYRKRRIYGRSNELNRGLGTARPMSTAERLAVYRRTIARYRLGLGAASALLALLSCGVLFYELGRRKARAEGSAPRG